VFPHAASKGRQPYGTARLVLAALAAGLASAQTAPTPVRTYVDTKVCAGCHSQIARTYALTGMGRSFYRLPDAPETRFYHKPSDTWYAMERKDGRLVQRRWRVDPSGAEVLVDESSVDYVMGSGNHVKTYLHRTQRGGLIELPLAWYSEGGGVWAMEPGYDGETLPPPRQISYQCMFCHNAYPRIPAGHGEPGAEPLYTGALPEGVDCQRCHGPGSDHVRAAQRGASVDVVRRAIVNPARLSVERQMEVCLQCHLETTSQPLPNSIVRYGREPFSYRPGDALTDFELFFDRASGSGHEEDFEIAHSAYRFRKSQCFLKSGGKLTCTTCHNPHDIVRGEAAARHYNSVCGQCHQAGVRAAVAGGKHPADTGCITCHMPRRRTQDVVHVVMTDHLIRRLPLPGDLLAPIPERREFFANPYRGEVAPYYPAGPARDGKAALYQAVAQVTQRSNSRGVAMLAGEIARQKPAESQFYVELGQAWLSAGNAKAAVAQFEQAARIKPDSPLIALNLADALTESGQAAQAVATLQSKVQLFAGDPLLWYQLAISRIESGEDSQAVAALEKCLQLDPDLAEAHNLLGERLAGAGDFERAVAEFQSALRIEPDSSEALANYGHVLAAQRDFARASYYFARSVQLKPGNADVLTNYAVTLAGAGRLDDAQRTIDGAVQADPKSADARCFKGTLLDRQGLHKEALAEFLAAIALRPDFGLAHLNAGKVLAGQGDLAGAKEHLLRAAASEDLAVKGQATALLRQMGYAPR